MQMYTIPEIGKKLGLKRTRMHNMVDNGDIGSVQVGKRRMITQEQYDEYIGRTDGKEFTIEQAASKLGVSVYTCRLMVERGEINVVRRGVRAYITQKAIDLYREETQKDLAGRVNAELSAMMESQLTSREEILVRAISRALIREAG